MAAHGVFTPPVAAEVDRTRYRVSGAPMSFVRESDPTAETLSLRERVILELRAEGLNDREISARFRMSTEEISAIRLRAAAKLSVRIASAHPFSISEVTVAHSLESVEL
jgi:DNA-binding CsgD family transcriptional regulator